MDAAMMETSLSIPMSFALANTFFRRSVFWELWAKFRRTVFQLAWPVLQKAHTAAKINATLKKTATQIMVVDLLKLELRSCKCRPLATLAILLSEL